MTPHPIAPTKLPTRRRRWWIPPAALAIGLLCGLLLAELALRVAGLDYRSPYRFDAQIGAGLVPGFRYYQRQEGRAWVSINCDGFRDRDHAREKPADVLRIAVLGDSYAEALQVDQSQTFWSVLERELPACDALQGQRVEVLNFGISGIGTAQEYELLRQRVWDFQPDVVLLAFLPGNDVRNNSKALEPDRRRPFYRLVDGELQLDDSFLQDEAVVLQRNSTSVWLKDVLRRNSLLMALIYHARHRPEAPVAGGSTEAGLDDQVYLPPQDEPWREAWAVTEALLRQMARNVETHKARFVVAVLGNAAQVNPDPEVAAALARRLGVADLDEPDRRLAAIGKSAGFPVVLLAPPMREVAQRDKVHLHGFSNTQLGTGHWNEQGHGVAGEILAREICRELGGEEVVSDWW